MTDDNIAISIKAKKAAKELGKALSPISESDGCKEIVLCVEGDERICSKTEREVYDGLKRGDTWLGHELIASYCDSHNIPWRYFHVVSVQHYGHGNDGKHDGHFIVTAYVYVGNPE